MASWDKCEYFAYEIKYGGLILTNKGIKQDPLRVQALKDLRPPSCYKELEILIGLLNWHLPFVDGFANYITVLNDLLADSRQHRKFLWLTVHQQAMMNLLNAIKSETLLHRSGPGARHIYVDAAPASNTIGGHIFRVDSNGKKFLMGYISKSLNRRERSYDTPKFEMMALWWCLKKFQPMCFGHVTRCFTDHKSLSYMNFKNPSGIWARWIQDLVDWNPIVLNVAGKDNVVADALVRLRQPELINIVTIDDMDVREQIVSDYHDHFSKRKSLLNIKSKYFWEGMYKDIEHYTDNCRYCLKNKTALRSDRRSLLKSMVADYAYQVISIDFLGPYSMKNGELKRAFIIIDIFSREVSLISMPDLLASTAIKTLNDIILDIKGTPEIIIGDSAKQFLGEEFSKFCMENLISYQPSAAYNHQSNPVERTVQTAKVQIHSYLADGLSWREALRKTQNTLNNK